MGRPIGGSMSSFSKELQEKIKTMRENNEGYGPQTILAELKSRHGYSTRELPNRSTIAAFLKEKGLVKRYERNQDLPCKKMDTPTSAHELWQLDGRGNEAAEGIGAVALLDIKDVFSKTYVSCFPAKMKSMQGHPNTTDYQTALRLGFTEYGLPKRVQVDHASVFHDNKSKSPFPTQLHLWLVGLGIDLFFSRVHRPTDQAHVERSHEILFNQILAGKPEFDSWDSLYNKCQERRSFLNHHLPSTSCNKKPPLIAHPEAIHSGRFYSPIHERKLLKMDRIYNYLAQCTWFRRVAQNNTISLGGQIYYMPKAKYREQLEITFCSTCKNFMFHNDKELLINMLPIKNLSIDFLMKNISNLNQINSLQLPIPFDWETSKINTTFSDSNLTRLNRT
jgi:transposase InsO family protein